MAENDDNGKGGGSWPTFLSELTKNFLILRDIFGYALPGAIFLTVGVVWKSSFLDGTRDRLKDLDSPAWLLIVVGLGVCYTIGHVMAGIAYFPFNTWGLPYRDPFNPLKRSLQKKDAEAAKTPFADLIALRETHPQLLIELERQSIMAQLRGSTGVGMLLGWAFFCLGSSVGSGWTVVTGGAFLLLTFWFSGFAHLAELREDTIAAARALEKTVKPIEPPKLKQILKSLIDAAQAVHDKLP
jgi:hypothetical protein